MYRSSLSQPWRLSANIHGQRFPRYRHGSEDMVHKIANFFNLMEPIMFQKVAI